MAENRGSLEPYIHVTSISIMGTPPPALSFFMWSWFSVESCWCSKVQGLENCILFFVHCIIKAHCSWKIQVSVTWRTTEIPIFVFRFCCVPNWRFQTMFSFGWDELCSHFYSHHFSEFFYLKFQYFFNDQTENARNVKNLAIVCWYDTVSLYSSWCEDPCATVCHLVHSYREGL